MDEKKPRKTGVAGSRDVRGGSEQGTPALFTLEVNLAEGPISDEFVGKKLLRTIELLGSHTLVDLHNVILAAFDRTKDSQFGFYIGGDSFGDPRNKRYGLRTKRHKKAEPIDAAATILNDLLLEPGTCFGYFFEGGWHHTVCVARISKTGRKGIEPRVVKRVGKAPPESVNLLEYVSKRIRR